MTAGGRCKCYVLLETVFVATESIGGLLEVNASTECILIDGWRSVSDARGDLVCLRSRVWGGEMAWDMRADLARMVGKVVIVTGGNAGLGFECARKLAGAGAKVVIASRSEGRGNEAVKKIKAEDKGADVEYMKLDLSSSSSIRSFVDDFKAKEWPLHVLVNNAGVANVKHAKTADGFEISIGTNYFGHFLLTILLLDVLKASAPARVVTVSSVSADSCTVNWNDVGGKNLRDSGWGPYGISKLYNVMFAIELERRVAQTGVHSFYSQPGISDTGIFGKMQGKDFQNFGKMMGQSTEDGAISTLYCATAQALEGKGGLGFGPGSSNRDNTSSWTCKAGPASDAAQRKRLWDESVKLLNIRA